MSIQLFLRSLAASCLAALVFSCTPKAAGPATTNAKNPKTSTASKPAMPGEELSPCGKFTDARNPDQAETDYVIYRQLLKAKDMTLAMKEWRKVYANSPAADGRRSTVFTDGVAFYNDLIQQDPAKKEVYGDTLLTLYTKARECYPGNGYMAAIQAFDSYYTYPGSATDENIYSLFKESIELDGKDKLQYFVVNPTAGLTVKLHREGKLTDAEAKTTVDNLRYRLAKALKECAGEDCATWEKVNEYTPGALKYFETVKGFYDCQYFVDEYYQTYQDNPDDCDEIRTAYSRMKFGGCAESSPELQELKQAFTSKCQEPEVAGGGGNAAPWQRLVKVAYQLYQDGKPREAVKKFEEAMPDIPADRKFTYQMLTAKIYYRDLRSFSQARAWARQASSTDPSSGEPYMLIGTLYASSGPLCGSGTGFNSQVVTWPAIDMWQRAKSLDESVTSKANKLINTYTQYMPSRSDVFQRGLKEGESFTVECWINETTRIRTP
ncbi:tetratricopeptide repeat protein [Neolewinella antarctica]|uniref:Tetratricopeptide (TPR) repeat protein n=1 Tax=Neolewinella antarctica TaxID=442734 RepID=A0ABX0XGM3_9BACT|nr:hypothetical protein [Neolewinella antarctica]NJC28481.1 tetratricopeptide (TPR) repeat protein [Neolewinella antarctica]